MLIFILSLFWSGPDLHAQNTPTPPHKEKEIGSFNRQIQSGKQDQKALETNLKKIEKDLKVTRSSLTDIARSIQKNEKTLHSLDGKITALEQEWSSLSENLQKDKGSIANLILALERIRRLPPEALIARPEAPLQTAQSAMLMKDILPAIHKQASELKDNLEHLEVLKSELEAKKKTVADTTKMLEKEQKELNKLVQRRTRLFVRTEKDLEAKKKDIAKISSQAQNLSDLVSKLNEKRTRSKNTRSRMAVTDVPKAGQPRLPLPGIIKTAFNEPDNFGAPNKGLDIEGREGALVVAPMGGVVQFAGFFKNYGNIVILEHEKGWHSLIAGLENIDTVVGQPVVVGEPLGVLHTSSSGKKPVLYYELRYKGKAVDPARKFGKLS